jgi:hypothetical protein
MLASRPGRRPGHGTRASPRTRGSSCGVILPATPGTGWQAGRRDGAEHRGRGTRTLERGRPEVQHVDGPGARPEIRGRRRAGKRAATLLDYLRAYRPATEHELLVRAAEVSSLVFPTTEGNRTGYHGRRGVRRSPTRRAGLSLGRDQGYAPETALRIGSTWRAGRAWRRCRGSSSRSRSGEPAAGAGGISPDQADGAAGPVRVPRQRPGGVAVLDGGGDDLITPGHPGRAAAGISVQLC